MEAVAREWLIRLSDGRSFNGLESLRFQIAVDLRRPGPRDVVHQGGVSKSLRAVQRLSLIEPSGRANERLRRTNFSSPERSRWRAELLFRDLL
jgi:hypothetical protein